MTASAVPSVVDALLALFAANISGASIIDGPPNRQALGMDVAAVGTAPDDFTSATASNDAFEGPATVVAQSWTVTCTLSSGSGGADMRPRRLRVAAMFDAVDSAIRADRSLGGVANTAILTEERWEQIANEDGVACDLTFVVAGESYLYP